MKPRLLVGMFLSIMLLVLAACGASTGSSSTTAVNPQRTSTPAQAATAPQPTDTPSPTATAQPQPTPTKTTPANAQMVYISLIEYQIISSQTTFSVNVPYHFIVTNKGQLGHQFMIMFVAGIAHPPLAEIAYLNPGETKTLDVSPPNEMSLLGFPSLVLSQWILSLCVTHRVSRCLQLT